MVITRAFSLFPAPCIEQCDIKRETATDLQVGILYIHTYVYIYTYMNICIYMCVCMHICLVNVERLYTYKERVCNAKERCASACS